MWKEHDALTEERGDSEGTKGNPRQRWWERCGRKRKSRGKTTSTGGQWYPINLITYGND